MSDSKVSHAHQSKEYKEGKLIKENKAYIGMKSIPG